MQTENLNTEQTTETAQSESNVESNQSQEFKSADQALDELKAARAEIESNKEEISRLVNFNETIKNEKKDIQAKYRDIDTQELESFRQFKEKAKDDKIAQLYSEGRGEEAKRLLAESQASAFEQTEREYSDRIAKLQELSDGLESQLTEQINNNLNMRKRQYFDGLVRDDDSFLQSHFESFVRLNEHRLLIDDKTGKQYALNEQGTDKMIDAKGEHVTFDQFYLKEKSTPGGLFWKAGTGTGVVSANGVSFDKPYAKMDREEKTSFRKSFKTEAEFMNELLRQRNAAKK